MRKIFTTSKYKRINQKTSRKRLRVRSKSKLKKIKKRQNKLNKSKNEIFWENEIADFRKVVPPKNFSFIRNPEQTIVFINKLEKNYLSRNKVFVFLNDITHLDYSAVTVLVSVMFSFKSRNIPFNGSFPNNLNLRQLLVNSEFFKYLEKPVGEKIEYTLGKKNQIFTRANKEVNSELGLYVMLEASKTIWDEKRVCKGLQRTLLELMQNTNNHADINQKGAKHWWLSVNHDPLNKKVSFVFVDYGIGIFESLKNKPQSNKWFGWFEKIKNKLLYGGNEEIFKLLLDGQMHQTVTGHHFRGKGLPGIKEVIDRNQISNLTIISNNVYSNVTENDYKRLNNEFSGTFVTWELNSQNENREWKV